MPTGCTPIYKIVKDGDDITTRFNDRATSITVQLKDGGGDVARGADYHREAWGQHDRPVQIDTVTVTAV